MTAMPTTPTTKGDHIMEEDLSRAAVIARIKDALQTRSGKCWSVKGGSGTAYGWITVDAPPKRQTWTHRLKPGSVTDRPEDYEGYDCGQPGHLMTPTDQAELATLLGLKTVHCQGYSIPASNDYYREALDRAEGRPVRKIAEPYWD